MSSATTSYATRIVGLGASAGGLIALEQFLEKTPSNTGMAFIVVQHLDPTQKALLPELLQRVTTMPVREAQHGMRIEPDSIYVIPSNAELSVINGALKLVIPNEPRGMRLPINVLFSSLASEQSERAIAVVLSGMGSDGTLGMQAIKAVGGLTVAQQPDSAQFDSMPNSAIAAGCADIVAPPEELPARIVAYVTQLSDPAITTDVTPTVTEVTLLQPIITLLQDRTRHDFSHYKPNTLHRRIERRMAIHGIHSLAEYEKFLEKNAQEIDLLFKELLIGVTSFFRDTAVWDYLANTALPKLLAQRTHEEKLRVWTVGCSSGEEAYSVAMIFCEVFERIQQNNPHTNEFSLQIFASDLSPDAIASARRGMYPLTISADISSERLAKFFSRHDTYFQIKQHIRDMVLFAQQDVAFDPPFTKLDMITCRNLLIYFEASLQQRLLPLFHYSLRPDGILLLGSSETVGRSNHLFTPLQAKLRFYLRQNHASIRGSDFLLNSFPPFSRMTKEQNVSPTNTSHTTGTLQNVADQVLLQVYAPAAVVINSDADIVYISGRTGKYLEPAAGKANWNFHAMARDGLRIPLVNAIKQAATQTEPVQLNALEVTVPGGVQLVDVTVQALHGSTAVNGMTMIVFRDAAPLTTDNNGDNTDVDIDAQHNAQLQHYRNEIQTLREEARASREELQSANEELQSTNEELQSTNEELTTSKEEMQSMNEELQTINAELQSKLDDLALAQSDMQNVLNSIEIAILFLDQNLNVRRYTDRATKIINLRASDVGRPLSDLTTSLQYPELHEDAVETLRTLVFCEKQITTSDNRWFSVRIMPYRRLDNMIDGVVITLVDITATKELESVLRSNVKA